MRIVDVVLSIYLLYCLPSLPEDHVLKHSYYCLKEIKEFGKYNWCTYVHEITIETGFEGAWESQILDKKNEKNIYIAISLSSIFEKC